MKKSSFFDPRNFRLRLQIMHLVTMTISIPVVLLPTPGGQTWYEVVGGITMAVIGLWLLYDSVASRHFIDRILDFEVRSEKIVSIETIMQLQDAPLSALRTWAANASGAIAMVQAEAAALREEAKQLPAVLANPKFEKYVRTGRFAKARDLLELGRRIAAHELDLAQRAARRNERRNHEMEALVHTGVALGGNESQLWQAAQDGIVSLRKAVGELQERQQILERAQKCNATALVEHVLRTSGIVNALDMVVSIEVLLDKASKLNVRAVVLEHLGKSNTAAAQQCVDEAKKAREFNIVRSGFEERVGRLRLDQQQPLRRLLVELTVNDFGSKGFAARVHTLEKALRTAEQVKRSSRH